MVTGSLDKNAPELSILVRGNVVSTNADGIGSAISGILTKYQAQPWKCLKIDLKAVKMVDSVGLNLILALVRKLEGDNRSVRIFVKESAVKRVFQISKLDTVVPVITQKRGRW
jgi:anti-anti-sigma factor